MQSRAFSLFSLAVLFLVLIAGLVQAAEIDDINAAIVSKHAKWKARETPLHHMDQACKNLRASLSLPTSASLATPSSQTSLSQPLTAPTAGFDWRNFGGVNYVTPPKDQEDCGSCWAFSTTAALESYSQIHAAYNTKLDLSEQVMISCSGAGSCSGGKIDGAATFIQQTGLPTDSAHALRLSCIDGASGGNQGPRRLPEAAGK